MKIHPSADCCSFTAGFWGLREHDFEKNVYNNVAEK